MIIPAIEINNVGKSFGSGKQKKEVLHDVSIALAAGEVFGFIGPNGAGKSTTIKLLLRFIRPDNGSIRIAGKNVAHDEFRHSIGYLAESPCFYEHLTAHETLLLGGRLGGVSPHVLQNRIPALLERMNLSQAAHSRVNSFSKGMKQRLGVANALIHDPQILIFDEPMSGLDPVGRHLIKTIILELKAQGKTIFFSSHILSDIEEICDRIAIIHKGRLLFYGNLGTFLCGNKGLELNFMAIIEEADSASLD